jgi:GNAT superfamily N-acetyltransferase
MIALETRYGFPFTVRPATHDDEVALAAFFDEVSDEDRRFRFLSAVRHVSPAQLHDITAFEHHRHETVLAFEPGGATIIAAATLAADKAGDIGEVAISILPELKGKGIGWTLLDHMAQEARRWGIKKLQSIESRDNHAAITLEREMGFTARAVEGDPALMLLERCF